jgi:hypothetical protein
MLKDEIRKKINFKNLPKYKKLQEKNKIKNQF